MPPYGIDIARLAPDFSFVAQQLAKSELPDNIEELVRSLPGDSGRAGTLLLDRSGSMQTVKSAVVKSNRDMLDSMCLVSERKETLWQQVVFGTDHLGPEIIVVSPFRRLVQRDNLTLNVPPLTGQTYQPSGGTPTLHALERAIAEHLYLEAAMSAAEVNPFHHFVAVVTDGQVNVGTFEQYLQIVQLVKKITSDPERGKYWHFLGFGLADTGDVNNILRLLLASPHQWRSTDEEHDELVKIDQKGGWEYLGIDPEGDIDDQMRGFSTSERKLVGLYRQMRQEASVWLFGAALQGWRYYVDSPDQFRSLENDEDQKKVQIHRYIEERMLAGSLYPTTGGLCFPSVASALLETAGAVAEIFVAKLSASVMGAAQAAPTLMLPAPQVEPPPVDVDFIPSAASLPTTPAEAGETPAETPSAADQVV